MDIDITSIAKLTLHDGDVVVVKYPEPLDSNAIKRINTHVQYLVGPKVKVLVIPKEWDIEKLIVVDKELTEEALELLRKEWKDQHIGRPKADE